jgi:hypothetical protein
MRVLRTAMIAGVLIAAVALWNGRELSAQGIPSEFTNLQVLPEDISRQEIVALMRGYVGAVGGGTCSYCHTVSDQLNQSTDDFASDAKATKRKARVMMEMVNRINTTTLPRLPDRESPNVEVTCTTCHGGITRPLAIADLMLTMLEEEGIEAAVAQYRKLREAHVGSRAYDFSNGPLNDLAERLGRSRAAEAIQFLELNVEFSPPYLPTLILLGNMHEANSDNESALRVYRGVLELDSALQFYDFYAGQARRRIEAIGGRPPA